MVITVDVREDGTPVRWTTDGDGAAATPDPDYEPALYAAARDDRRRRLEWLADVLAADRAVSDVTWERRFRRLDADERSPVLRISVDRLGAVGSVARDVRRRAQATHAPGTISLYDVDLDPGFRYCLDAGHDPTPDRDLRTLSLSLPTAALAEGDLASLRIEGGAIGDDRIGAASTAAGGDSAARRVERALAERDPDVLVVSSADLVPLLAEAGVDLGRRPGYRRLAGESTYVSYGRVGHSPARYAVPGRAIVDRSNSFLLGHSGLAGLLYLVEHAGKPLQELARDSIGGVLTAIEVRRARERDVLAPWQKRQTEGWKSVETLHAADRGGVTFQPEVGVHEGVHELDFASLYPNVIREYNVSPETVCCGCHDRADVPELGYSVCDEPGFLGDVLAPLLDDRQRWKRRLDETDDPAEIERLRAKIAAVKWVLVSCFGYQGFRHAKFGRIETHEAINAVARDILLTAKEHLEDAGWRVVHGIVDSLWVTPAPDRSQRPVDEVAAEVTDAVGIELEREGRFDWIAFTPRAEATGAALMRYFGRWADESVATDADSPYKLRGIEARQRGTPTFVADAQRDLVAAFDRERDPVAVCDRLARHLARLRRGDVDPADLVVTQRVSKELGEYQRASRAKAALERAADLGVDRHPGQDVRFVVVDDGQSGPGRVRLAFETDEHADCDVDFYADRLVAACASVVAPLGWDERRVRRHLAGTRDATLSSFGG